MTLATDGRWYTETLHENIRQTFRITDTVFRDQTGLQDLVIFDTPGFGRVLALDGVIQTTTRDEPAYHEMLVHVPILGHGRAEEVLIVGGGDGGAAREALKHAGVKRVTLVEIDRSVVDLCREYLPTLSDGAFDDPRLDLVIADGCQFVKETDRRFDVIVIDSTDPIGPGAVLFTQEFYADCKRCLTPGGVMTVQGGVPLLQPDELKTIMANLAPSFAVATAYTTVVPTYHGGFMSLGYATDDPSRVWLTAAEATSRAAASLGADALAALAYYTPDHHPAAFALPKFIRDIVGG